MKNSTWRARARRTLAVVSTAALTAGLAIGGAGSATAADRDFDVTGGSAEWGVKASFRNYITSPIARGAIEVTDPAGRTDDGGFAFEATGGTVTGTTADIAFAGGVHFEGHLIGGVYALDMDFSNIRVLIDGDDGTLVADVVSREFLGTTTTGELEEFPDTAFGEIDLSENPLTVTDGVATVEGAPVTLSEAGAAAFGGFYEAETELDPLSFSVEIAPAGVAPTVTTQPQDVTADEGEDAVFTAAATGTPEPTVQWQSRTDADGEWADVDGATGTSLTQPSVTAAQDGTQVRAVFTNGTAPDAVTEAATLVVVPAQEPVDWEPAIEVFAADGVTPLGDAEVTWGETVVVKGTGFDPAANVGGRGVPIPSTLPQGTYVVFGKFLDEWQPSAGAPSSARVVGSQKWALAEDVLDQVPAQFQGAIRSQWVDIAEDGTFSAELTIAKRVVDGEEVDFTEDGAFGIYTYGAGGVANADQEQAAPVNVVDEITEPVEWEPAIEVFAADGVTPLGDAEVTWGGTVVVKGTGFDPAANVGGRGVPIPADLPQGTYVVFGKFLDEWQPSAGAPSSARVVGSQQWALAEGVLDQVPAQFQGAIRSQWVDIAEDGTFTAELTIAKRVVDGEEVDFPEDGAFGIYTYGAGGVANADQEQAAPVNVVDEITEPEWDPQLTVTPTEGLTEGTVVTVEGTGYAPNRAISVAFTTNTVTHEEFGWPVGWLHHEVVTTDDDGSFTREITISGWETGTGEDCSVVECFLATFNSAQASDVGEVDHRAERDLDVFVPVTFIAGEPEPEPGSPSLSVSPDPVRQGEELTVVGSNLPSGTEVTAYLEADTEPATGHLDWGVKESFRSYLTGPIAHGSVELDGVTRNEDGTYRFPALVTSSSSESTVLSFGGTVSFRGHQGDSDPALEIHVADPRIQLTEDAALLIADVTSREFIDTTSVGDLTQYPGVVLATLDREAFDVEAGSVTAAAAAAELTEAGAPAFGSFYDPDTELDPVSVEVVSGGAVELAATFALTAEAGTELGSGEIGEDGTFAATWTVPAQFPLGAYTVVLRTESGAVVASDALTVITAAVEPEPEPEPEPQPQIGTVVVEPDPVRQGATATFVGSDLTPGTTVGAVIDAAGAPGTLEWGVKESFRSYITGPIANGDVVATAPASRTDSGTFVFGSGTGSGDAENGTAEFAGTVSFAGHEIRGIHALELEIVDPAVVIEDGTGRLVADVHSREFVDTTSTGELTETRDVVLAELDLTGGAVGVIDGRLVGTEVPATLTAAGVSAFADFYEAGDALDPVTFSVPVGEVTDLDLTELDTAEATVAEDGTVELTWAVPADATLGVHTVHLVTNDDAVADTAFTVVGSPTGGDDVDPDDDATPAPKPGGTTLPTTGATVGALTALAAAVLLTGAAAVGVRRRMVV